MLLPYIFILINFEIYAPWHASLVIMVIYPKLINVVLLWLGFQRNTLKLAQIKSWSCISWFQTTKSSVSETNFSFESNMIFFIFSLFFTRNGRHGVSTHDDVVDAAPWVAESLRVEVEKTSVIHFFVLILELVWNSTFWKIPVSLRHPEKFRPSIPFRWYISLPCCCFSNHLVILIILIFFNLF